MHRYHFTATAADIGPSAWASGWTFGADANAAVNAALKQLRETHRLGAYFLSRDINLDHDRFCGCGQAEL